MVFLQAVVNKLKANAIRAKYFIIFFITIQSTILIAKHYPNDSIMPAIGFVFATGVMILSWHGLKYIMDRYDKRNTKDQ